MALYLMYGASSKAPQRDLYNGVAVEKVSLETADWVGCSSGGASVQVTENPFFEVVILRRTALV